MANSADLTELLNTGLERFFFWLLFILKNSELLQQNEGRIINLLANNYNVLPSCDSAMSGVQNVFSKGTSDE
jgi:hypothetical protein